MRIGGVGVEACIITNEIYNQTINAKFIPVLKERNSSGAGNLPTFAETRRHIDFSSENQDKPIEELLRTIHRKRWIEKPEIGDIPELPPMAI